MGKNHNNGPAGHYYCELPPETAAKFEELMKRYGLVRAKKMWRHEVVSVNWCKRDRDGKITFLVYEGDSEHPTEHDSLEELDAAIAGEFENEETMREYDDDYDDEGEEE